jgi:exopolysaccharide biosynthesis polyprenyl glycosylphosphotransferase
MTSGVRGREGLAPGLVSAAHAPPRERIAARATGWRIADGLLGVSILAGVVIAGNLDRDRMPNGLQDFLAIRVTIKNVLLLTAFGLVWPAILSVCGLYSPARLRSGQGDWPRLLLASAVGCMLAMVFVVTSKSGAVRPEHALFFGTLVLLSTAALRGSVRAVLRPRQGSGEPQILIVGSGPLAARIYHELCFDPLQSREVIGFVDSEAQPALGSKGPVHLGGVNDLERILMHRVVDRVFIGLPIKSRYEEIQHSLMACERLGVPAQYPADLFRTSLGLPFLNGPAATPVLSPLATPDDYHLAVKRVMDVVGAGVLLVLLAPLMLTVALVVKLTSPGPVLFTQERYGYMKRRFRMYKFRTMVTDAERLQAGLEDRNEASGPAFKIRRDPRLTRFGRFLRRSSFDELPQLWNVLMGTMSLVGPRPMAIRDVGRFTEPWLMRRFSMRPGLTCLWQISDRSDLGFERWIALDLEYIDRWSLSLDLSILVRTIPAVIRGSGAV